MSPWAKLGISFTFVFVIEFLGMKMTGHSYQKSDLWKNQNTCTYRYLNASFLTHKLEKEIDEFSIEKGAYFTHLQSCRQAKVYSLQLPSVWINLRVVPMCVCYSLIVVAVCASINFYCLWFPLEQLKCRLYVFLTAAMGEIACFHL